MSGALRRRRPLARGRRSPQRHGVKSVIHRLPFALAVPTAAALAGCSLVVDAGRFDVAQGDGADRCDGGRRTLVATLIDFQGFGLDADVELLVVESASGRSETRAVVEGLHPIHDLSGEIFEVRGPCMIPGPSGYEVRAFVDVDDNGIYTPPGGATGGDPAFIVPIEADGTVTIDAGSSPQADISENLDTSGLGTFTLAVTDMTPHVPGSQRQELHLIDVTDGDAPGPRFVAGYHRIGDIETPDYQVELLGVLVPGRSYRVELYADLDQDGVYDDPPADHSWKEPRVRETFVATLPGEVIRFSHRVAFDPLDTF